MKRLPVALGCVWALAACNADCALSPDIQLTLVADSAIDAPSVRRLRLSLSIEGGAARTLEVTPAHALRAETPAALLLRPDPPPAQRYRVQLTIEALDADGQLVGVGAAAGTVLANGCNRLDVRLAGLPLARDAAGLVTDGGVPDDLASTAPDARAPDDLAPLPADLSTCVGATPDEDGDGVGDACDRCPADYDPGAADGDGDGLPDACDPDPGQPGNRLLMFDGFNQPNMRWSGSFAVQSGWLGVMTQDQGSLFSLDGIDALPPGARAQTWVYVPLFEGVGPSFSSDVGLFLGSGGDPSTASGVLCSLRHVPGRGDTLDLNVVTGGNLETPISTPFPFSTGVLYRLRLVQHGAGYGCEAASSGMVPAVVSATLAQAPSGSSYVGLRASNVEAHFHSVVAESVLP